MKRFLLEAGIALCGLILVTFGLYLLFTYKYETVASPRSRWERSK